MELHRVAILDQIHRLTNDPLPDHLQRIQKLKSGYNQIVKIIRNNICGAPRDILDIFPSEVWIQIVKDALPVHGYSSALLLLTMVSNKWRQTLTSVPTLWTHIELRGSQEDPMATVEAFRLLSRDATVYLSIYVPTRHDHSTICAILMSIGPRIREVTIASDRNVAVRNGETWTVLRLLLTGSQFNSSLTYIHLEDGVDFPRYHEPTREFMKNNPLPPSLRAIRGWSFAWRDLQEKLDWLKHVEAIDSYSSIERVLSRRVQLPNLRSLTVVVYPGEKFKSEDEEGFPSLQNLTSLNYNTAYPEVYPEVFTRLLHCVAPQLVHLSLGVPYTKIPRLAAALTVAINLRALTLTVQNGSGEDDEGQNERGVCPVYQPLAGEIHSLRALELCVIDRYGPPSPEQAARRGSFLSFLMSTISGLYTKVGSLRLEMRTKYPIAFDAVLSYVRSLPELRTLELQWLDGYLPGAGDTHTLGKLEYFYTSNVDVSHCLRTPNLLSLGSTWESHRNLEALTYSDLRRLLIDSYSSSVVELPESSFPSLQELHVRFISSSDNSIYGTFKLTSFPFLKSITVTSLSQPQGTMLCFSLLNQPSMCPSLSEIKFHGCFPDWDILFLMLEKRNFMADRAVSLIRRIILPFIPSELCGPLASLLGGKYAERPLNNDLFMGGARELLLDEQVPGCIKCLLRMRGGCKGLVRRTRQGNASYQDNRYRSITGATFAWTETPQYGDPDTLDWMVRRNSLLDEFILNFATWKSLYHREEMCRREPTRMEIAEDGVIARDASW